MSHIGFRKVQFVASLSRAASGSQYSDLPSNYANLAAWWKADSLALTDGTAVASWTDSSTNSNTLTASGTQRPTYKTAIYNGQPTVRFNGSTNLMAFTNQINFGTNGDFTIIGICMASTDSILFGDFQNNIQIRKFRSGANNISKYFGVADQTSDTFSSAAGALVCCGWRRTGNQCQFRENATSRNVSTDGTAFQLNRMSFVSFAEVWTGDICEACIYTAYRTDGEVDSLYNNYFKLKWGLP